METEQGGVVSCPPRLGQVIPQYNLISKLNINSSVMNPIRNFKVLLHSDMLQILFYNKI